MTEELCCFPSCGLPAIPGLIALAHGHDPLRHRDVTVELPLCWVHQGIAGVNLEAPRT